MAFAFSTFDGTENPISEGAVWTSGPGTWGDLQKAAGKVRVAAALTNSGARYIGNGFGPDQWSEITTAEAGAVSATDGMGACTRMASDADGDCYVAESDFSSNTRILVERVDDNGVTLTFNSLVTYTLKGVTVAANQKIQIRSIGTKHYLLTDGSYCTSATDSTYTTGQPGCEAYSISTSNDMLDAWSAGESNFAPCLPQGANVNPSDNGSAATDPLAATAPSPQTGALLIMIAQARIANLTPVMSETANQTWTAVANAWTTTTYTARVFYATFNGNFNSKNPSVSFSSTTNNTVILLYVNPPTADTTWNWGIDVALSSATHTGSGTITITGQTTTRPHTVSVAGWGSVDDNTWQADPINSTGLTQWLQALPAAQVRNTAGNDSSIAVAYQSRVYPGSTNDVGNSEATLGADAGMKFIVTFYAFLVSDVAATLRPKMQKPILAI